MLSRCQEQPDIDNMSLTCDLSQHQDVVRAKTGTPDIIFTLIGPFSPVTPDLSEADARGCSLSLSLPPSPISMPSLLLYFLHAFIPTVTSFSKKRQSVQSCTLRSLYWMLLLLLLFESLIGPFPCFPGALRRQVNLCRTTTSTYVEGFVQKCAVNI